MIRAQVLAAFLFIAVAALARQKTDVIVMSNGDRITGEIKGLNAGVLRVDLDYVDGTISVQWSKVKRLESSQLFIVQAQDGSVYTGALTTAPSQPDRIAVLGAEEESLIDQARVVRLEETSASFFRRWSGDINLGVVYSKGNNATQYTLGSEIEYRRERWGLQADFNSNLSSNTGSATSTRNQLDLIGYRLLPDTNYFYGGLASFLQSSVQGISRQTTLGGGFGRYFKNTNRARVSVLAGLAWQRGQYEPSVIEIGTQEVGAALLQSDAKFFVFKKTNLTLRASLLPAFTGGGRYYINTNASYYIKLFKNFSWNTSFYGNWDTRPPGKFSGSDYGYSSGIKWTFGYK